MWRAHLVDGAVVDHDGENTHLELLDRIVRFELFAPNGAMIAQLEPGPRERVVFRWVRAIRGGERFTLGCKAGILNRDTGEVSVREWLGGEWVPTDDVVLEPVELA